MKIEDKTGSHEFRLFKDKLVAFRNYGVVGTPIIAHGMYQKRQYNDTVDFNLTSMELLEQVKGTMVHSITINLKDRDLKESFMTPLKNMLTSSTQNRGDLFFNILDSDIKKYVLLHSRYKIPITKDLIDYLNDKNIEFEINKN